eukprot:3212753-Amphidinium_carterae.1
MRVELLECSLLDATALLGLLYHGRFNNAWTPSRQRRSVNGRLRRLEGTSEAICWCHSHYHGQWKKRVIANATLVKR